MPRLTHSVPKYRKHKASGQAIVTIAGKDHYLGPHGTKASKIEYDRLIGEWLASGRPIQAAAEDHEITISELVNAYRKFAEGYYVKNGQPTGAMCGIKVTIRTLRQSYGHTPASEFGPLSLKALRQQMIQERQSRRYINDNIARIRRVFKWAVGEELISPAVYQALAAVPDLRRGRTDARESPRILPVTPNERRPVVLGIAPEATGGGSQGARLAIGIQRIVTVARFIEPATLRFQHRSHCPSARMKNPVSGARV